MQGIMEPEEQLSTLACITKIAKDGSRKDRTKRNLKMCHHVDIESSYVVKWILEKHEECQIPVSTMMIRLKASSLVKPIMPDFKASEGWVRKFLARNNLVLRARTSIAQTLPSDLEEKVARFHQNVTYIYIYEQMLTFHTN